MSGGLTPAATGGAPTGTEPSDRLTTMTDGAAMPGYVEPGTPAQPGAPVFENALAGTSVTPEDIQVAAALINVLLFASLVYVEVNR
ncbi:hypothetical protein ACFQFH_20090 [Halobaculum halobium]|uniref:Uncharacterized protein n=1 Tax=Halobaculum halobium TaxID=3032281 RepID=A0ABD5TF07_9EURY|nr:hypothetical protein [Halobaculum sp. SYNS20]